MFVVRMVLAMALVVAGTAGASADPAESIGVLDETGASLTWSGVFEDAVVPDPSACAVAACDSVTVDVDLPPGTWNTAGGVLFAIRSPMSEFAYDLDLHVYGPDGSPVASSAGFYFNHEAALVPSAPNGRYRVVVVPTTVIGRLPYEGIVNVQFSPAAEPVRDLLPNIVPLPPRNPHLESGMGFGVYYYSARFGNGPSSCYPSEIAAGARRCLRFDQPVANFGDGPFEMHYRGQSDGHMRQRVYRSDGSTHDEPIGAIEWHAIHGHFHYAAFTQGFLYEANADGTKGRRLRTGNKTGFCMADTENLWFGRAGDAPMSYTFDEGCQPSNIDGEGPHVRTGISRGWADAYAWYLADQYIEVSGIADGTYVLELRVNLDGAIRETSYDDNAASALIRLSGDTAEVIG